MRPDKDEYFINLTNVIKTRSTCPKLSVGCLLINKHGHILSTGYNGVASGLPHCLDEPCKGALYPKGAGLGLCEAIHAEQNALLQCSNVQEIATCYVTTFPCLTCLKLLLNTSCQRIVYLDDYSDNKSKKLWIKSGRKITKVS